MPTIIHLSYTRNSRNKKAWNFINDNKASMLFHFHSTAKVFFTQDETHFRITIFTLKSQKNKAFEHTINNFIRNKEYPQPVLSVEETISKEKFEAQIGLLMSSAKLENSDAKASSSSIVSCKATLSQASLFSGDESKKDNSEEKNKTAKPQKCMIQ